MTSQAPAARPYPVVDMGELSPYADRHRLTAVTEADDRALTLRWDDGATGRFHYIWLRDHCACRECRHPQTRERIFRLVGLPETLPPPRAEITDAGALQLTWPAMPGFDEHRSDFDPGWLRQRADTVPAGRSREDRITTWDASLGERLPTVAHADFMTTDSGLTTWLKALDRYGVALLTDGPVEQDEVVRVAKRVGWPRETNFGRHFDVVSKPNPNNAAYTAIALDPHVDLPNWRRPPDFQLLYCLENRATGGASTLTDGFAVAEALRAEDPEAFELLASQPVDFRFQDETADLAFRAPVIGRDDHGGLAEIRFNNWIRDTLYVPGNRVEPFYRAYRRFWQLLSDPRYTVRFTLQPGQMIAFDNPRVLHGREAFDPDTGSRHLQGAYLDRDLIRSRLRVLERAAS